MSDVPQTSRVWRAGLKKSSPTRGASSPRRSDVRDIGGRCPPATGPASLCQVGSCSFRHPHPVGVLPSLRWKRVGVQRWAASARGLFPPSMPPPALGGRRQKAPWNEGKIETCIALVWSFNACTRPLDMVRCVRMLKRDSIMQNSTSPGRRRGAVTGAWRGVRRKVSAHFTRLSMRRKGYDDT